MTYEEAVALQQGRKPRKGVPFLRKDSLRRLICIPCWAKPDIPNGVVVYLDINNMPVAHTMGGIEAGEILNAHKALVPVPHNMELANDP